MYVCVQLLFFIVMLAKIHCESVKLLREGTKYIKSVWNVIEVCHLTDILVFDCLKSP